MSIENFWKGLLIWFAAVMLILAIAREFVVVIFGVSYGLGFGYLAYRFRHKVRPLFKRFGMDNYWGFILLAMIITVTEETYVWALGGRIAHPILWVDLILVSGMWTVWFSTWHKWLAKKYKWSELEALLAAASIGVLYEYVGTGEILGNPFGLVIAIPLAIVVYAAIFMIPMQLIDFTGKKETTTKWPVSIVVPFIATFPVALLLYVMLSLVITL
jgi:hypothetical protein